MIQEERSNVNRWSVAVKGNASPRTCDKTGAIRGKVRYKTSYILRDSHAINRSARDQLRTPFYEVYCSVSENTHIRENICSKTSFHLVDCWMKGFYVNVKRLSRGTDSGHSPLVREHMH